MNGRRKGNAAEREVARLCAGWWAQVEPGCKFVRTPLSGGWGGPELRGKFFAAGDLMTTSKRWPFTVEVKRRERWKLQNLIAGKPCPVWGWWLQVQDAAAEEGRQPMLWFRKSREQWRVMLPVSDDLTIVEMSWSALRAVNHGVQMPMVVLASDLLAMNPKEVLRARDA